MAYEKRGNFRSESGKAKKGGSGGRDFGKKGAPGGGFSGKSSRGNRDTGFRGANDAFSDNKYEGARGEGGRFTGGRDADGRPAGAKGAGNRFAGGRPTGGKFAGPRDARFKGAGDRDARYKDQGDRGAGYGGAGYGDSDDRPVRGGYAGGRDMDGKPEVARSAGGRFASGRPAGGKFAGPRDARFKGEGDRDARYKDQGGGGAGGSADRDKPVFDEMQDELDKLEGRNSILEALKAGRTINKLLVAKGEREGSITQIVAMARQRGIVVQEVEKQKLDSLSSTRAHQGVIAFVAVKDYVEVDDILAAAQEKGEKPFIIILDEISDAYNLGSILRTAECVGAHGVIIPKRRAVGLTPAVSKASAGAIEYMPVAKVTNISQTIDYLKKQNIWVIGTDSSGRDSFFNSDLKVPLALVIGSEGEGMGRLVREKCDYVVNIPMKGHISSLNAAVAGAIVMYEILKQRGT